MDLKDLTPEKIAAMQAGPECDVLVAKALGVTLIADGSRVASLNYSGLWAANQSQPPSPLNGLCGFPVKQFSACANAAHDALGKLGKSYHHHHNPAVEQRYQHAVMIEGGATCNADTFQLAAAHAILGLWLANKEKA